MANQIKVLDVLVLTGTWYFLFATPALAYFDIGVGTYLVQLLFGVGAAFFLSFRSNIMRRFSKKPPQTSNTSVSTTTDNESADSGTGA